MKHITMTITLFFLLGHMISAQETLSFSLTEAQEYAIEHNKTLKDARLNIDLSERKLKETVAQGLPQVDASVDWMTYFGYEMEFNFGGSDVSFTAEQLTSAMNNTMNNFQGVPGMFEPVTQQDFYVFGAMQAYQADLQSMLPPNTIKMTDASTAKLQIGQLLFSGQYWAGIQVAKLGKEIATKGLENSILDIKESVTNSYIMALITEQTIETFQKTITNLNTIKGHTQNMYTAGLAEQTDVDQISIQVTMLENNLRSMERGQQMIHSMLKFQLGLNNQTQMELSQDLESVMAGINPMSQPGAFDMTSNSTWQLLETQEKISQKMIDMQKWTYAPTITGFYAYNQKLLTTGFDMTPNNLAGITMSVPVFSSGSRNHKLAQARIEYDKALLSKSMVEDQLQIQHKQLVLDLNTAVENYESQKENVIVARRVYENIQNKYEQGMASSLDLTQSNNNYIQAESNFIQATLSLLQAKVALNKLFNQL
jgi:outer membrane protein